MELRKLQQKKQELTEKAEAIFSRIEKENRSRTQAERREWDSLIMQAELINNEINLINRSNQKTPMHKDFKKYNLFRAVRGFMNNNLDGVEAEMHQEAEKEFREAGETLSGLGIPSMAYKIHSVEKRASIDTTSGSSTLISNDEPGLNIIKTPTFSDLLGVTRYEGLVGKLHLHSHAELIAAYVVEKASLNEPSYSPSKESLTPRRIGLTKGYTKEFFSQTSQSVMNDFMSDFYSAIRRGVDKDLVSQIVSNTNLVLAEYEEADTAATMDLAMFIALEEALQTDALINLAYLTTPGIRAKAKQTPVFTNSAVPVWNNNEINGYPAIATPFVPSDLGGSNNQHAIIMGGWSQAVIGQWGAMEMIVDPYTGKKTGEIEVTVNGLFDAGLKNEAAFATVQNLSIV